MEIIKKDPYLEPYKAIIEERIGNYKITKEKISKKDNLSEFANAHLFYGLHLIGDIWVYRDWLPNATEVYLVGDFTDWELRLEFRLTMLDDGVFEVKIPAEKIKHKDLYKIFVRWSGGEGERVPAYALRAVQDTDTKLFSAQVWRPSEQFQFRHFTPPKQKSLLIYEAHIGMSSEAAKVSTFKEFTENILPHIVSSGYNVLQLMAIQEHPYYGSFGYHVANFFAVSSRFGTPEDLKQLIDTAHSQGLMVIMDLVHSHSVKNEAEGLSRYDGSEYQYFHEGIRGTHPAWDSRCFDYSKKEVLHFLLSNCKFWLQEYNFDGFRFDGITSMLYKNHGLETDFTSYEQYFDANQDKDAITYLMLANDLIHSIKEDAIVIAEEMSGMPGIAEKIEAGGYGFDYRLAMGVPDFWIKIIKKLPDEEWNVETIFYELTNKRPNESVISYAESHDQALVGDKTIFMRLAGKDIYEFMGINGMSDNVQRAVALHKIIRLLTSATAGGGYLNFMGNEFGHPEWIDFPRSGNNWSHQFARRQWSLCENTKTAYHYLYLFDNEMIRLLSKYGITKSDKPELLVHNVSDQVLIFKRADLLFVFNLNPNKSFVDYGFVTEKGTYKIILNSDSSKYLGYDRIDDQILYSTNFVNNDNYLHLYLPNRTAFVLEKHS